MNRQDGPLQIGGLNENTNVAQVLRLNDAGELLTTGGGGGGTSDVNLTEVGGAAIALGQAAMAASLPVVLASNQTAVPVSGPLTDTQLRATAVPVSGPLTDTQLRATAVPVSLATAPTTAVTVADGANVVEGSTTGAAVITDVNGTIQQYLRGIVKLLITAGTVVLGAGTSIIGAVKSAGYQNAMWYATHVPATNVVATITQASAGGSTRNVCTGFTVSLCAGATAPTAVQLSVALIDGATGGTNYLWRSNISLPATAGAISAFIRTNGWFVGTAATAMTLEFSAAGGTSTFESVSMSGTTTL